MTDEPKLVAWAIEVADGVANIREIPLI